MTLNEIAERLKEEFPKRYVSFGIHVNQFPEKDFGNGLKTPERSEFEMYIYTEGLDSIDCSDLEGGINQLKIQLGMIQPNIELAL